MTLFPTQKVAVVFDWDKTLSPHYMQRPIFKHYNIDEKRFWERAHYRTRILSQRFQTRCFVEHEYLNLLLDSRSSFPDLTNTMLYELGKQIEMFPGVGEIFADLHALGVEIYVVSCGIRTMLQGIPEVSKYVKEIHASEFYDFIINDVGDDFEYERETRIQGIAKCVIPSDKTRILNEISKGSTEGQFDPCLAIPDELRRIPFSNMIYVGDGVSDIYGWDVVKSGGGYTVGVWNPDEPQYHQVEMLRKDGWLDLMSVADFRTGSTAHTWLVSKCNELLAKVPTSVEATCEENLIELRKHAPEFIHKWSKPKE